MSLFPTAHASTGAATQSGEMNYMSFLPMIIIFVLFWFLLIRPQQKKAKLLSKMVNELQKGDEVITNSGILGKISKIEDPFIMLEIANNVVITIQKNTVSGKIDRNALNKNTK